MLLHQGQRTKPSVCNHTTSNNQHTSLVNSNAISDDWTGQEHLCAYLLGNRTWIGSSGQRPLLPKSEDDRYMLSVFVSCEFGSGRVLTKEELDQVNAARQAVGRNTCIAEQEAAKEQVLERINKSDLKESPPVKSLFIGASNEGYRNSFHMNVQFEDVVNCLQVLYPKFEFVTLTALTSMSRGYGGAHAKMRNAVILREEGNLGPHSPILKAGDIQSLMYLESKSGPWYLPERQQLQRHDRPTGQSKRVERSIKVLAECLRAAEVCDPPTAIREYKNATTRICKEQWH
jgi:hypothetical protein